MAETPENGAPSPPAAAEPQQPPDHAHPHAHTRQAWISFAISMLFTVLLVLAKMEFEKTDLDQQFEEASYGLLQRNLGTSSGENPKIVVIDISSIPMRESEGLMPGRVTDRTDFTKLAEALVALNPKPRAIGFDVDFSPSPHGYADAADPEILNRLLELQDSGVPIRVGISSSISLGPGKWLVDPKYLPLAACVDVPHPGPNESTRSMLEKMDINYTTPQTAYTAGDTGHCPSMGYALATVGTPEPLYLKPFVESRLANQGDRVFQNEFLVDYSPLDTFIAKSPAVTPGMDFSKFVQEHEKALAGSIVLIGRGKYEGPSSDTFTVPGRPGQRYAGVFLHASAAHTLLNGRPLFKLTELGRWIADIALSAAIFGIILVISLKNKKPEREAFLERSLPVYLAFGMAVAIVWFELKTVHTTHLMWDDFLIVAVVLLIHSPIEQLATIAASRLASAVHLPRAAAAPAADAHSEGE